MNSKIFFLILIALVVGQVVLTRTENSDFLSHLDGEGKKAGEFMDDNDKNGGDEKEEEEEGAQDEDNEQEPEQGEEQGQEGEDQGQGEQEPAQEEPKEDEKEEQHKEEEQTPEQEEENKGEQKQEQHEKQHQFIKHRPEETNLLFAKKLGKKSKVIRGFRNGRKFMRESKNMEKTGNMNKWKGKLLGKRKERNNKGQWNLKVDGHWDGNMENNKNNKIVKAKFIKGNNNFKKTGQRERERQFKTGQVLYGDKQRVNKKKFFSSFPERKFHGDRYEERDGRMLY
jgi:hypothetical protein